jgi:ferredoxin
VKVQTDPGCCQGQGRCCDLVPGLFSDDEGYGTVLTQGTMPPGQERVARLAVLNRASTRSSSSRGGDMAAGNRFGQDYWQRRNREAPAPAAKSSPAPVPAWATDFSHVDPAWAADPERLVCAGSLGELIQGYWAVGRSVTTSGSG